LYTAFPLFVVKIGELFKVLREELVKGRPGRRSRQGVSDRLQFAERLKRKSTGKIKRAVKKSFAHHAKLFFYMPTSLLRFHFVSQ
jgi:hypothetical protein